MKSLIRSTIFVLIFLALANAHDELSKPLSSIRAVSTRNKGVRRASVWGSFLNFLRCPPGPLSHCDSSSSSSNSDGSNSSNSSKSTDDSDSNGDDSGGDSASDATDDGSSGTTSTTSNENQYYDGEKSGSGGSSAVFGSRNAKYAWVAILGGVVLVATVVAAAVHGTSKNNDLATGSTQKASAAGGAHALSGVVGKRNKAFKNAMRKKLGWKKDASGLSESLA